MDNQLINSIIEKYQFSKKQIEAVLTLLEEKIQYHLLRGIEKSKLVD
ncbi:TPA: HU family DNA-binding protein [Staphylococcus aureus]|nr:conserved domain protein [Staphylococcus aureus subsp. aureus 21259]EHS72945.1 hypothetical protein IS125_1137 [Staphylococcus aureus subsp. aureus IS-125]HAR5149137.1 HU family DNA-binding protein [Staphylococcus aureus]